MPTKCAMPQYRRAKGSVFFFTVALADRRSSLLIREIDRFRRSYRAARQSRPFETIAICVLPDHVHALWEMPEHDADFAARWSLIKAGFSRGLDPRLRSRSKILKREKGIWQRRYWEHAIRNDQDLARHVEYIHFNPVKHGHVTRVSDRPHSSFHRYVQHGLLAADWGATWATLPDRSANEWWARREGAPLPTLRKRHLVGWAKPPDEVRRRAHQCSAGTAEMKMVGTAQERLCPPCGSLAL